MHPRIAELHALITSSRKELNAFIATIPAEKAERAPGDGGWTPAEVIDHIGAVERGVSKLMVHHVEKARAAGLGPELDSTPLPPMDRISVLVERNQRFDSPERVLPRAGVSMSDAKQSAAEGRAALMQAMAHVDGLALGEVSMPHPALGPLNIYEWFAMAAYHELRHRNQIREILEKLPS